jgi:hypothetical protein
MLIVIILTVVAVVALQVLYSFIADCRSRAADAAKDAAKYDEFLVHFNIFETGVGCTRDRKPSCLDEMLLWFLSDVEYVRAVQDCDRLVYNSEGYPVESSDPDLVNSFCALRIEAEANKLEVPCGS